MSNPRSPAAIGQVVSLAKSPQYWRRRAEQHRKRGEHHRAAALLRHAVALEPASGDLRMEYARTLRDISCYEASTREAFGALAMEPSGFAPYQIIGRNMLSLGRDQEAVDAFSHYLQRAWALPEPPLSDPEDDELFAIEDLLDEAPGRGRARLDALCRISSQRLTRGDLAGAKKSLDRAERLNPSDERLHTLSAMLFEFLDQPEEALDHALLSVLENPAHVPSLCALASVYVHLSQRSRAAAALMKAAFCCRFPHDEQLFCFTATGLDMPELSLAMLRLSNHKNPSRLPTLYNYAVTLLCLGRLSQALGYLHRCLDLDPEDLPTETLFHTVQAWEAEALPDSELRKRARALAFYPFLPAEAVERLLKDFGEAFDHGIDAFARRLLAEPGLYRVFLYAVFLPSVLLPRLIPPIAGALAEADPAAAERLLREILLQSAPGDLPKRHALSALMAMEAKPPFVLWQEGRILQIAPPEAAMPHASALARRLYRRIAAAARLAGDPRLIPHALALVYRMPRRCRYAFAADQKHAWTIALLHHYALTTAQSALSPGPISQRARRALAELSALIPLN